MPDQISPVVHDKYPAVRGCHTIENSAGEIGEGFLTLDWVVEPDGSVHSVQVAESTFAHDGLENCVVGIAEQLQFPRAGDSTEVTWKFSFK